MASESNIVLFPVVFSLGYTRVHVCTSNSGNEVTYIEASVNKILHFNTTLDIPNVHPNHHYI